MNKARIGSKPIAKNGNCPSEPPDPNAFGATLFGMADVRAEMTANVWQVPAEVGQTVSEGDVLVILESMKMEIPVEAPKAGTVTEVRVKPDDQVQEGDVLVVIS